MKIKCEICGKEIVTADDLSQGQHVRCPYCNEKFSYSGKPPCGITRENLAQAIAKCRKDPTDNHYYSAAPAGARLYIGLIFFGKVFKDTLDKSRYMEALTAIEPELSRKDLEYLIAHEDNQELIEYFKALMQNYGDSGMTVTHHPTNVFNWDASKTTKIEREEKKTIPAAKPLEQRHTMMQERKLRADEMIRKNELRRKLSEYGSTALGIAAVAVIGWIIFSMWQNNKDDELRRNEAARIQAKERADSEQKRRQEAREKAEQEKSMRREREMREREERRIARAKEIEAAEREAIERQTAEAERQKAAEAKRMARLHYNEMLNKFHSNKLIFVSDVPFEKRPWKTDGTFACAIPDDENAFALYEMTVGNGNGPTIVKLSRDADQEQIAWTNFQSLVNATGCVYSNGERSYCQLRMGKIQNECSVPTGAVRIAPGALVLGNILPLLKKLGVDYSGIRFSVALDNAQGFEKDIAELSADEEIGRESFRRAVQQKLTEQKRTEIKVMRSTSRKPDVSVVLYDGMSIMQGADGITYVPRYFNGDGYKNKSAHIADKARIEWIRIKKEAERQQEALAQYERDLQQDLDARRNNITVMPWEVDAVLKRATVRFSRIRARRKSTAETDDLEKSYRVRSKSL